jgi:hypothetical protein
MKSALDSFQEEVARAFFRHSPPGFFLTGGGALAGFYLGHRGTKDLDLFTTGTGLDDGVRALQAAADDVGATLEATQTYPDFRRFLMTRPGDSVVIDLVRDRAPQLFTEKRVIDGVVVDPIEEIFANKLCTVLSRCEARDLVDLMMLERAGLRVEDALGPASAKDGGLTPGQLAWVVSQIEVGADAKPPGGVSAAELRDYLKELERRLTRMAFPAS